MAKIVIEIEDLPNGGIGYKPTGDVVIMKNATPAQITWIAMQKTVEMLDAIGSLQKKAKNEH